MDNDNGNSNAECCNENSSPITTSETFILRGDLVTLGQLLKLTGIVASGGEAKLYLSYTAVLVNGQPEQRRGRKLRMGDLIEAPGEASVRIICGNELPR